MSSLNSLNKVFDSHVNLLKQLNSLSTIDTNKGIFNKKNFCKYYEYEITGYNDSVFIKRIIDEFIYDPKFSKAEKEFTLNQLNSRIKDLSGQKFIDVPEYLDRKYRTQFAEEKYIELGHVIFRFLFDEEIKSSPKISEFFKKIMEIEGWQKPVYIMENIQIFPSYVQIEAAKAFKRQVKRKLSYKLCYPIIDANNFLMSTSKEDFDRIINRESCYDKLENDILEIATRIIERKSTKRIENQINDDLTDHLRTKGYNVTDQTRSGRSSTGNSAGSIDIMIRDERHLPITIIEALRLKSIGHKNKVLDEHLMKLLDNYDSTGLGVKYLVVYVEAADFEKFCSSFYLYIASEHSQRNKKIAFDSVGHTKRPYGQTLSSLKTIDSFVRIGGSYVKIKHVLMDMKLNG